MKNSYLDSDLDAIVVGLRPSGLIQQLIRESYDVLNARFTNGLEAGVLGMYFELENRKLIRARPQLVWNELGANIVFVGKLPNGNHARVWYFERAKVDDARSGASVSRIRLSDGLGT